jgi:hypothetical protein
VAEARAARDVGQPRAPESVLGELLAGDFENALLRARAGPLADGAHAPIIGHY